MNIWVNFTPLPHRLCSQMVCLSWLCLWSEKLSVWYDFIFQKNVVYQKQNKTDRCFHLLVDEWEFIRPLQNRTVKLCSSTKSKLYILLLASSLVEHFFILDDFISRWNPKHDWFCVIMIALQPLFHVLLTILISKIFHFYVCVCVQVCSEYIHNYL